MSDTEELKNMILNFRVSELQVLLGFAGRNKSGKKQELQSRALDLLKLRSAPVQMKIKELHKVYGDNFRRRFQMTMSTGCEQTDPASIQCAVTPVSQLKNNSYPMQRSNAIPPSTLNHNTAVGYLPTATKQIPPSISTSSAPPAYPVYPDVRFKPLPFYDISGELLKPASLMPSSNGRFQENTFQFHLTPHQAHAIAISRGGTKNEHTTQIQLRFCLLETSCEQDDNFPPSICVKCNGKICPLPNPIPTNKPGVEPKRPSRPVNITAVCKISPTVANTITVSWASEYGRAYAVAVYLVQKRNSGILLSRLKASGVRNPDHTRAMIKEKLQHDPDSEIATTSLRGSLICPLGKMRMIVPCRSITCTHLQCFDASLYLQMNEKKPTWICPVCDKPATFKNLVIDGLFTEITTKAPSDCTEVQFHEDGSWTPLLQKKESHVVNSPVVQRSPEKPTTSQTEKRQKIEIVDLTIDSNSDNDSGPSPPPSHTSSNRAQSYSSRLALPSVSLPSLSLLPTTAATSPLISLPSPNSSPSSSLSSTSSVVSPYSGVIKSTLSSIPSNTVASESSEQYSNAQLATHSSLSIPRSTSSSGGIAGSSGPPANSSTSHSPVMGNSMYPGMNLISPDTQPYYPQVSSPFHDYLPSGNPSFNSYSNFDLFSLLQPTDNERQAPSYPMVNSLNARKTSSSTPDVISLD